MSGIALWGAGTARTLRPIWVAEELGIQYELHPIGPRTGEIRTAEFTRLSRKQKDRMELMQHEQILANESVLAIAYEGFGEVRQARPAARFNKTPSEIARPAPKLGEHSREVLAELGYAAAAQQKLIDAGAIAAPGG